MIYFDNAATSFPKPKTVINAYNECIKKYCGNPGRSSHYLAIKSSEEIYDTREKIASLINYDKPENVVFTLNATYALNMAIKTSVKEGQHVLVSDIEHNSVIRPLEKLQKTGKIQYDVFNTSSSKLSEEIEKHILPNTGLVVCNLASNVTGEKISLKTLSDLRQKYKFKLIVDASQFIGHGEIDFKKTPFDILCAPSHKSLFGIQGSGFCIFCGEIPKSTFIEGGSGSESLNLHMPDSLPEHFEGGTLPTPAIVSLSRGIDFINKIGLPDIEKHLDLMCCRAAEILNESKNVKLFGADNGIVSFTVKDAPSYYIAAELNKSGIAVRNGLHCAPLIHKRLGTEESGCVRLSFSYFNKISELDKFYKLMKILA